MIWKSEVAEDWVRYTTVSLFAAFELYLTYVMGKRVQYAHLCKKATGHKYDKEDITFDTVGEVIKISLVCMIAAILCGCTGIAGGMVLGPLFMSYGMNAQVMSSTNQFITMVSADAVLLQFVVLGEIDWTYSLIFGFTSLVSAYIGIMTVKWYIARSGRESVIALILMIVLVFALISLPIKSWMDSKDNASAGTVSAAD